MDATPPAASPFLAHFTALYGESAAASLDRDLHALLAKWRPSLSPAQSNPRSALTERDALLITYADQVQAPDANPLATLSHFANRHLRDVVSGVHLLPFYPWSSDDGFSVKDYYAVDPAFGTWDDIARLGTSFDLMFDAVFNHLSAQGEWFQRFIAGDPAFRDFFVTVEGNPDLSQVIRPRALPLLTEFATADGPRKVWTTFSADQVDLNVRNPAVLLALVDVLLFYLSQGATFIRLDAIAFLWKEIGTTCLHRPETHRAIQLLRAVLESVAPSTRLVTETNVPHQDNLSYFGDGTNEAHLIYNFALPPLVLHTFATGDARRLATWARSLSLPGDRVAFFNFLASHDGIGVNPARGILTDAEIDALLARTLAHGGFVSYKHLPDGSRAPYEMNINFFDALSDPASPEPPSLAIDRMRCAHAIQLALAGVPGIYFHSLFGSRGDRAGAEASGIPRRINRRKLTAAELERDLADPASRPAQVFAALRQLLAARGASPAFHPGGRQEVLEADSRAFVLLRTSIDETERLLCVHNISADTVTLTLPLPPATHRNEASWRDVLAPSLELTTASTPLELTLPPFAVRWMRWRRG